MGATKDLTGDISEHQRQSRVMELARLHALGGTAKADGCMFTPAGHHIVGPVFPVLFLREQRTRSVAQDVPSRSN